ncbi:MAG: tRNA (guanosine(37)-N1)-methyltransferase TrmD [Candidatus Yanofskybacteria bacterium]|nr:tRNA (guanosine(37)-N1)-methyltransferase TrmD [Candidatus Yanofskybacteria bacterium]
MTRFDIITIFPNLFDSFKNEALIARAQKKRIIKINAHNLRKWTEDKHKTVDDKPYGGGVGMVLKLEPIMKAVEAIKEGYRLQVTGYRGKNKKKLDPNLKPDTWNLKTRTIVFSPKGKKFNQQMARRWSKLDQLVLICGRYEGIDERAAKYIADEEVSIGDYVLFGGEVPAMVVMEAVARLIPGAVQKKESIEKESFTIAKELEHPQYTRPEIVEINGKKRKVPKVLLSGNHKKIEEWRKQKTN